MTQLRTDLALEAHEISRGRAAELPGAATRTRERNGIPVTEVAVTTQEAARALGKPVGVYVTLDLGARPAAEAAARALGAELRALVGGSVRRALVVGLGNAAMTPDALGPLAAERVLVTRHLRGEPALAGLAAVSALTPGVLGRTGLEAAELVRAAAEAAEPDVIVAVDALAARALARVCTTVQLTDAGVVPGSGVGNRRAALNRETLGVPVIAVGAPTVVDAATLARDVLAEAGASAVESAALRGSAGVFVTTRDIDAQVRALAGIVAMGVNLALHPLDYDDLRALTEG